MARGTYLTGNRRWWERSQGGTTGDPRCDAAQNLRLVAGRFLNGRANEREVNEAIGLWRDATKDPAPSAPPPPAATTPEAPPDVCLTCGETVEPKDFALGEPLICLDCIAHAPGSPRGAGEGGEGGRNG